MFQLSGFYFEGLAFCPLDFRLPYTLNPKSLKPSKPRQHLSVLTARRGPEVTLMFLRNLYGNTALHKKRTHS